MASHLILSDDGSQLGGQSTLFGVACSGTLTLHTQSLSSIANNFGEQIILRRWLVNNISTLEHSLPLNKGRQLINVVKPMLQCDFQKVPGIDALI